MSLVSLIGIQDQAVQAIVAAREQGKRASCYGLTLLNRNPRVIRGIRRKFEKQAAMSGFHEDQIRVLWDDVKDMARLEAGAFASFGGVE